MTSFLHSKAWERFQQLEGHTPLRHEGQLYTNHRLPFGTYVAGYRLNLGNLPTWPKTAIFARLEPINTSSLGHLQQLAGSNQLVPTLAIQPRQTSLVDIATDPETILARFTAKFRYNLRLAERKGVEISIHQDDALEQLPRFQALLDQTAQRQGFRIHAAEHYRLMTKELAQDGMVYICIAQKDGVDLAAILVIICNGTATYLHGASSDQDRQLKASNLLHWRTMLHAKAHGCTVYDLWGIHAVHSNNKWLPISGHPSEGVTHFKLSFGGQTVEYPGTFDLVFQPFWYSAYKTLRGLRSAKRAFS